MHRAFQDNSCFGHMSCRRRDTLLDVTNETKATLVQRANEALVVAAVAERAPCRADPGAQRRLRDDAALPNRVEQLVLADDSISIPNEVNQQIEYLRLDVNRRAGASQLLSRDVDLELGEAIIQSGPLIAQVAIDSLTRDRFVK